MIKLHSIKYLLARRTIQLGILVLFMGGHFAGWNVLKGNYSSGLLLGKIPLSDPFAVLQILSTGFVSATELLLGAVIVAVLYGLFFGRMFCSWICPMNVVSDSVEKLNQNISSKNIFHLKKQTRYYILALSFVLSALLGVAAFETISPIGLLHRAIIYGIGGNIALLFAFILFDLAVVKNGWCGYLCPLGAFYALIGKF